MSDRTILVVDDSGIIREQLSHTLRFHGYTVLLADNGGQGLTVAMSHPEIDLFIVDINMPNMNGLELLQAVRADYPEIKIGFVTSEQTDEMIELAMQNGALFTIGKPFTVEIFQEKISLIIGES